MAVDLMEWIARVGDEYLADFIPAGGSAVKIAVAPPDWADSVLETISREAHARHFFVARVDSAQVRFHRIDQVFHTVARRIDWDAVADQFLRDLLSRNGIAVAQTQSLQDLDTIAAANDRSRTDLFGEIHRLVSNSVGQNYSLHREFRTALSLLCWGRVNPQNVSPSDADVVKQWLCGEKCSLATLKRLQIFGRIGRHNARLMLSSTAVWLREAGYSGLALLVDLNAVVTLNPPPENLVRYTRSTALDVYEVLRQFIDDTDEAACFLLAAVAGPGLVEDPRRSVDNYAALRLRIIEDVRDKFRSNPLNTLVRLGASGSIPASGSTPTGGPAIGA